MSNSNDKPSSNNWMNAVVEYMTGRGASVMFDGRAPATSTAAYARRCLPRPVASRPRASARRRREHRTHRRAQSPSRGDPPPLPGSRLYAALVEMGGAEPLELARAGFYVFRDWTEDKWRRELASALKREIVDVEIDDDGGAWLRAVGA
jgi:hypothetical protein